MSEHRQARKAKNNDAEVLKVRIDEFSVNPTEISGKFTDSCSEM